MCLLVLAGIYPLRLANLKKKYPRHPISSAFISTNTRLRTNEKKLFSGLTISLRNNIKKLGKEG